MNLHLKKTWEKPKKIYQPANCGSTGEPPYSPKNTKNADSIEVFNKSGSAKYSDYLQVTM